MEFKNIFGPSVIFVYVAVLAAVCHQRAVSSNGNAFFNRWSFELKDIFNVHDSTQQRVSLFLMSLVGDIFVLLHHLTVPVHPKFRLLSKRKLFMAMHMIAGTAEIFLGTLAFFTDTPEDLARAAAVCAFFHVFSAFQQMSLVFGTQAVMVPSYFVVTMGHLHLAVKTFLGPSDPENLLSLELLLHTFVWVRVFISVFANVPGVRRNRYTYGVLFAGLLTIPSVYGVLCNLGAVLFIAIYANATAGQDALAGYERQYDGFLKSKDASRRCQQNLMIVKTLLTTGDKDLAAMKVAKLLDQNNDGCVSRSELTTLASMLQISMETIVPDGCDRISVFDCGYRCSKLMLTDFTKRLNDPIAKNQVIARLVFDELDINGDGVVDVKELSNLLVLWGLPATDAMDFVRLGDTDNDKALSLDEFTAQGKLVWSYVADCLTHSSNIELRPESET
uniref:EF-hand domain-containing protein n=1 Tax=Picocystis salinarum TaxID=88271 RepID=A0A7S3XEE7_9CHLO|mmetsp:Transcript_4338/g.15374  ORF Transcript_4338/g.15374 Transcript_4338/m.15374 type:complete len:446 (+) Transcript_4338:486-1823(+)